MSWLSIYLSLPVAVWCLPLAAGYITYRGRAKLANSVRVAGLFTLAASLQWSAVNYLLAMALAHLGAIWTLKQGHPQLRFQRALWCLITLIALFSAGRLLLSKCWGNCPGVIDLSALLIDMVTLMRLVALYWECGTGRVDRLAPPLFWQWALNPFALMGPVVRPSEYSAATAVTAPAATPWKDPQLLKLALMGYLQLVGAAALAALRQPVADLDASHHYIAAGLTGLLLAPMGFYLLSAGGSNLAESFSRMACLPVPPNFNAPFGRPNISEFWANWNMTVTRLLRDILFYQKWGMKRVNIYANVMVLFVLCGAWHEFNAYWLLWGFLHGSLFCSFLWLKQTRRFTDMPWRWAVTGKSGAVLTYVAVCACWYLPSKIIQIIERSGI